MICVTLFYLVDFRNILEGKRAKSSINSNSWCLQATPESRILFGSTKNWPHSKVTGMEGQFQIRQQLQIFSWSSWESTNRKNIYLRRWSEILSLCGCRGTTQRADLPPEIQLLNHRKVDCELHSPSQTVSHSTPV